MKFRIHCEEANHICDKSQYRESSLLEKLKLKLHLLYCNACRKYSSRNQKLTVAIKNGCPNGRMPEVEKTRLKEQLHQEMKK